MASEVKPTPFGFQVDPGDYYGAAVYDPFTFMEKTSYGITVAADALPPILRLNCYIRPGSDKGPLAGREVVIIKSPYRPEMAARAGWEYLERRLRQAKARNIRPDKVIFDEGREALRIEGVSTRYGPDRSNPGIYAHMGIHPDMWKLTIRKITIL